MLNYFFLHLKTRVIRCDANRCIPLPIHESKIRCATWKSRIYSLLHRQTRFMLKSYAHLFIQSSCYPHPIARLLKILDLRQFVAMQYTRLTNALFILFTPGISHLTKLFACVDRRCKRLKLNQSLYSYHVEQS